MEKKILGTVNRSMSIDDVDKMIFGKIKKLGIRAEKLPSNNDLQSLYRDLVIHLGENNNSSIYLTRQYPQDTWTIIAE